MELKEQGMSMRLSLVLGNALVLNCAALALTATMLSSLLELFSQASFFYFQLFLFSTFFFSFLTNVYKYSRSHKTTTL